jgi:hypothetical protein
MPSKHGPAPTDALTSLAAGKHPERHDEVWTKLDNDVVDKAGDQTLTGVKTFRNQREATLPIIDFRPSLSSSPGWSLDRSDNAQALTTQYLTGGVIQWEMGLDAGTSDLVLAYHPDMTGQPAEDDFTGDQVRLSTNGRIQFGKSLSSPRSSLTQFLVRAHTTGETTPPKYGIGVAPWGDTDEPIPYYAAVRGDKPALALWQMSGIHRRIQLNLGNMDGSVLKGFTILTDAPLNNTNDLLIKDNAVGGSNSNRVYLDASGRFGVGPGVGAAWLLAHALTARGAEAGNRVLDLQSTTAMAAGVGAGINLTGPVNTGTTPIADGVLLKAAKTNGTSGDSSFDLAIWTRRSGTAMAERMRVKDDGSLLLKNAVAVPAANDAAGGFLYVEAGALKYRGSAGTVTTLAAA